MKLYVYFEKYYSRNLSFLKKNEGVKWLSSFNVEVGKINFTWDIPH